MRIRLHRAVRPNRSQVAPLTKLTSTERALVDRARRGETMECDTILSIDDLRKGDNPDCVIRGVVLRELLLGRHGELDAHGVQLSGYCIAGAIDLAYVKAAVGLHLTKCVLVEVADLRYAHFPRLYLSDTYWSALNADGLRVDGSIFLGSRSSTSGQRVNGAVVLSGGRIDGQLTIAGQKLVNQDEPALNADGLRVAGSVFLKSRFETSGQSVHGAVCLVGAEIDGQLDMTGAHVISQEGSGLVADRLTVGDSVVLNGVQAEAMGGGDDSMAVRLVGATVHGQLDMRDACLTSHMGSALNADRLTIDGDAILHAKFRVTSHNPARDSANDVVRLAGARIGDMLHLGHEQLSHEGGGALLNLENAQCSTLSLDDKLICPHGDRGRGPCPETSRRVIVDRFGYDHLDVSWQYWLHLVRYHTKSYRAQPYQQLAATQRAAGHDRDARRTLIEQEQDHRKRGDLGGRQAIHVVWGALAGYGYRTGHTAVAALVILVLMGVVGFCAGHTTTSPGHYAAERQSAPTSSSPDGSSQSPSSQPCSLVELIGLGIDRGLPLPGSGVRHHCDLDTDSTAGGWFTAGLWALRIFFWFLVSLVIAGITGLVRKIR